MNIPYFLYMAEAEGVDDMVSTRRAKINAIGRELQKAGYVGRVVPATVFLSYCHKHGIYDVTQKEINHIEKEWL